MADHLKTRYRITAHDQAEAEALAERISLEQSAELPKGALEKLPHTVPVGKIRGIHPDDAGYFILEMDWPAALFGQDRLQLLNVLFGNISLLPGIRLESVEWSSVAGLFPGPAQGISGIRQQLNIYDRPLSCAALKPIGLTADELADWLRQFVRGGFDIIKDDHGLADQPSAPFSERLEKCSRAAAEAEQKRGRPVIYAPNVTASPETLPKRLELCRKAGLRMVMISPHLTGPDSLSLPGRYGLGVMAHPAFSGSMVLKRDSGIAPHVLYGEVWRALGADGVIYPNAGGRFVLSPDDCKAINQSARNPDLPWNPSWPIPGGGMQRNTIHEWTARYGNDTIFLIGGSIYEAPEGIEQASAKFTQALQQS